MLNSLLSHTSNQLLVFWLRTPLQSTLDKSRSKVSAILVILLSPVLPAPSSERLTAGRNAISARVIASKRQQQGRYGKTVGYFVSPVWQSPDLFTTWYKCATAALYTVTRKRRPSFAYSSVYRRVSTINIALQTFSKQSLSFI